MLQPSTDAASRGAFKQSWAQHNPRDKFKAFIEANPDDPDNALAEAITFFLSDKGRAYVGPLVEYAFNNAYRSWQLLGKPLGARQTPGPTVDPGKAAIRAQVKEATAAVLEKLKILSLLMPNGKVLGDCTLAEAVQQGSWIASVARVAIKSGRDDKQPMRKVFSEEELQRAYHSIFAQEMAK